MNQPFHVITVVWGRPYLDVFLDVAVPNQLTAGNLGALPAGSRYRVFTSAEDVQTLVTSPNVRRVNEIMPIDVIGLPELSDLSVNALDRLITGHRRALAEARESGAALIFLNADHFMSEGALAAVVRRHAAGSRAVASTGIRLNKDTFVAALEARGGIRRVSPRELVSLALDNLHPFTIAHMIDGSRTACSPISVYWNVPDEGIIARAFYLHPLMIDSALLEELPNIDAKYLGSACPVPEQVHLVSDSDELCLFELSHVDAASTETTPGGISLWRAATMLSRCDAHQKFYWRTPVRLHAREIGPAWRSVEEQSASFAADAMRLRIAARWLYVSSRRLKPVRRQVGAFTKRVRRAAKAVSRTQMRRSVGFTMPSLRKLRDRTVRSGRLALRRARRSVVLLAHSATRPVQKLRKRAARAGRRLRRRAYPAH